AIAGTGLPYYKDFEKYNPEQAAKDFFVISKHSLEKTSAWYADCFTAVSETTATECMQFLNKEPDIITHNGFDASIIPDKTLFNKKRMAARQRIKEVAEAVLNQEIPSDSLFVIKSGRYEFRNKGIDVFIDAMAELKIHQQPQGMVIGIIFVPGPHTGPLKEVQEQLGNP